MLRCRCCGPQHLSLFLWMFERWLLLNHYFPYLPQARIHSFPWRTLRLCLFVQIYISAIAFLDQNMSSHWGTSHSPAKLSSSLLFKMPRSLSLVRCTRESCQQIDIQRARVVWTNTTTNSMGMSPAAASSSIHIWDYFLWMRLLFFGFHNYINHLCTSSLLWKLLYICCGRYVVVR